MKHTLLFLALLLISFALHGETFTVETVAGTGKAANNGDAGLATKMNVGQPFGVEIGPDGALYITEVENHRVRRLDLKSQQITTVAGSGTKGYSGDGGPATKAELNEPYEVRFDEAGNMYFVEMRNHLIRRVDRQTGKISTIAGTGKAGYAGDGGPATKAQFSSPHSIAFDEAGNLYVADIGNHRVRKIDMKTGVIDTIVGTGEKKNPTSGSIALGQPIYGPRALAIGDTTMWIVLREGNSVWRLDLISGIVKHVAGTGKKGYSGPDGEPLSATFDGPKGCALDAAGRLCIVDTENQVIRVLDDAGRSLKTIAGKGPKGRGFAGDDGPALGAEFDRPHGIGFAPNGDLYIGDTNNHRVRRLRPNN
jgi:sugar lactone lactonase YvrE